MTSNVHCDENMRHGVMHHSERGSVIYDRLVLICNHDEIGIRHR